MGIFHAISPTETDQENQNSHKVKQRAEVIGHSTNITKIYYVPSTVLGIKEYSNEQNRPSP